LVQKSTFSGRGTSEVREDGTEGRGKSKLGERLSPKKIATRKSRKGTGEEIGNIIKKNFLEGDCELKIGYSGKWKQDCGTGGNSSVTRGEKREKTRKKRRRYGIILFRDLKVFFESNS